MNLAEGGALRRATQSGNQRGANEFHVFTGIEYLEKWFVDYSNTVPAPGITPRIKIVDIFN